ncbi:chemotaxis protein CheD [Candidatus Gastranaerophilus sp. (ex Termes propinquus)]|nr:chemotaxis protein CheD [Candidatus Gastranaerophilus sp. (ex Termes propinquus)]
MSKEEQKYFLQQGGIFACWKPYCVATVLGSGVAVCLCDPVAKVGGVSHFTVPKVNDKREEKRKYMTHSGEYSLPHLMTMMGEMGATKQNMEAHIVGGSFSPEHCNKNIGRKNIEIAKKYLKRQGVSIVNEDTSGNLGRKVLFNTANGEIIVYKLRNIRECDWNADKSTNNR